MGVGVREGDGGGGDPVPDVSRIMHEAVARRVFPGVSVRAAGGRGRGEG